MGKTMSKPGFVELDPKRLYNQVRATRDILGLSWPDVWAAAGVSKASLDRLKRGATIEATTLMRLMTWLGILHIDHFTRKGEQ